MSMLENRLEVSVESKPGLPGVDVLTFELISFKTPTRLLLAAYVPREGYDAEYLRKRFVFNIFLDRSAEGSSISHHIYITPTGCLCEIQTPGSGCRPSHQQFPSSTCQVHQSLKHRSRTS